MKRLKEADTKIFDLMKEIALIRAGLDRTNQLEINTSNQAMDVSTENISEVV